MIHRVGLATAVRDCGVEGTVIQDVGDSGQRRGTNLVSSRQLLNMLQ